MISGAQGLWSISPVIKWMNRAVLAIRKTSKVPKAYYEGKGAYEGQNEVNRPGWATYGPPRSFFLALEKKFLLQCDPRTKIVVRPCYRSLIKGNNFCDVFNTLLVHCDSILLASQLRRHPVRGERCPCTTTWSTCSARSSSTPSPPPASCLSSASSSWIKTFFFKPSSFKLTFLLRLSRMSLCQKYKKWPLKLTRLFRYTLLVEIKTIFFLKQNYSLDFFFSFSLNAGWSVSFVITLRTTIFTLFQSQNIIFIKVFWHKIIFLIVQCHKSIK